MEWKMTENNSKERISEAQLSLWALNQNQVFLQQRPETQTQEKRNVDMRLTLGFDFAKEVSCSLVEQKSSCRYQRV